MKNNLQANKKSGAAIDTWPRMNQLEREINFEVTAHSGQEDLDLDGVGDDDTQEVVGVAGLRDGRASQVRFVTYLRKLTHL